MDPLARQRLPQTRDGVTRHFALGGHDFYVRVGCYEDGKPGEIFITEGGESGSHVAAAIDLCAQATSMALQYGVPLRAFVDHWRGVRTGDVCGVPSADPYLSASSLWDALARWMADRWPAESSTASIPPASETKEGKP